MEITSENLLLLLGIIISIGGGIWAYYQYIKRRTGIWNLEMSIEPEQIKYSDRYSLIMIKVSLKNIGNVKIIPGPNGCTLSVKQIPCDLEECDLVDWKTKGKIVVEEYDILEQYKTYANSKDYEEEVYTIEPQCEYHDLQGIIVPNKNIFLIELTFWWRKNKDSITEYSYISVS